MRQEQTRKKYQEEREAAEKMADVKKNARKDQPWLHVGLMVKVPPPLPLCLSSRTFIHQPLQHSACFLPWMSIFQWRLGILVAVERCQAL